MGEEDEEEECFAPSPFAAIAVDRDAVATAMFALAAAQSKAMATLFDEMAFAWAAQANKNMADVAFHEDITREIETLPTTEE